MTKSELCSIVGKRASVPGATVEMVLDRLADVVGEALVEDNEAPLPGIGKLKVKQRAAREGRNPRTGEVVQVPAKRAVVLKVGKALKDAVK